MRVIMCQHGSREALLQLSMREQGGKAEEVAMLAFGQLAGLPTVLSAVKRAPSLPGVVRGGLGAIAELVVHASEVSELQWLPALLEGLLEFHVQSEGPGPLVKCKKKCVAAICATVCCLSAYAEPGQVATLDQALLLLVKDLNAGLGDLSGEGKYATVMENIVETLGRVALVNTHWRDCLKSLGVLDVMRSMISTCGHQKRLVKYCFWCAAAFSGLSFVVEELKPKLECEDVVDGAFCSMIDILDDDIEGDWVLKGAERCPDAATPSLLKLVAEAMRKHADHRLIQSRGCHCVALLFPLVPQGALPSEAVAVVLLAMRLHGYDSTVMRDACSALRALLDACTPNNCQHAHDAAVKHLREEGIHAIMERALSDFADSEEPELLEDAIVVLSSVTSVDAALQILLKAGPGSVRNSGVKALFELFRNRSGILCHYVIEVKSAIEQMLEESPGEVELHRNAELLVGLCDQNQALLSFPAVG